MEIQGVKQGRARQLFNAGFRSVKDIASADVDTLIHQIEHFSRRQAHEIISGAKMLLHEEYEHIMQQAEEIFSANADANASVDDIITSLRPSS
uniref:Uncharacterized protein n=1 Tax=Romanomermis culicivorax TaxID=13658 RepID=A0A915L739_ROMCU